MAQFQPTSNVVPAKDALWVSSRGSHFTADGIHNQVSRRTRDAFGIAIGLHTFRTIAASTLADRRPDQIHLASDVLAHRDPRSRDYYIEAEQLGAIRRSHNVEDAVFYSDNALNCI